MTFQGGNQKALRYFDLSGSVSCFDFDWNPFGPKLLISSIADNSYKASLQNGFMPRWKRRCFTVFGDMPIFSAISLMVKPSMLTILTEKLKKVKEMAIKYLTHYNL